MKLFKVIIKQILFWTLWYIITLIGYTLLKDKRLIYNLISPLYFLASLWLIIIKVMNYFNFLKPIHYLIVQIFGFIYRVIGKSMGFIVFFILMTAVFISFLIVITKIPIENTINLYFSEENLWYLMILIIFLCYHQFSFFIVKKIEPYFFGIRFKDEFKPFIVEFKLDKELHLNDFRKIVYLFQFLILLIAYGLKINIFGVFKNPLIYSIASFIIFDQLYTVKKNGRDSKPRP